MSLKKIASGLTIVLAVMAGCGDDPVDPPPPASKNGSVTLVAEKDNTLYEYVPPGIAADTLFSNAKGRLMFAGLTAGATSDIARVRRALMQFDLGSIPAGATIDSVCLSLRSIKRKPGFTATIPFGLHKASMAWGEGTSLPIGGEGGGARPTDGDVTWLHTFFDISAPSLWTTPGGDFAAVASATMDVSAVATTYKWGSTAAMVADVQAWLDNPASNFGWALVGGESTNSSATGFGTREDPSATNNPTLEVYYTKP